MIIGFRQASKCANLIQTSIKKKQSRLKDVEKILTLTKQDLKKKKMSELLDALQYLNISTEGLIEKEDYINAILNYNPSNIKNKVEL